MNDEHRNEGPKPEGPPAAVEPAEPSAAGPTGAESAPLEAAAPPEAPAAAPEAGPDQEPSTDEDGEYGEDGEEFSAGPDFEGDPGDDDRPRRPARREAREEPPVDPESIIRVVGVKFRRATKTYFFNAGPLLFSIGEQVIVETDRGLGLARIVTPVIELKAKELPHDLKKVIRKANWNDLERDRKNRERETEALRLCQDRVKGHGLPMKLVRVEYLHDASKAIFYFTAEHRVDFRDLVKDLARQLHTRIEMRQIGVRDETKLIGGLGPCGREVCCSAFLTDFSPVSVRMAKDQNLAMNPAKVSGLCGRLMCCLSYEHRLYAELIKKMPKKGKRMFCPEGPCRIIDINVLAQKALVEIESGETLVVTADQLMTQAQALEREAMMAEEKNQLDAAVLKSDDPAASDRAESRRPGRDQRGRPAPPSDSRPYNQNSRQRGRADNRPRPEAPANGRGASPPEREARGGTARNDQSRDRRPGGPRPDQNRDRSNQPSRDQRPNQNRPEQNRPEQNRPDLNQQDQNRPDRRGADNRRGRDLRPPDGSRPYSPPPGSRPYTPPEGARPSQPPPGREPREAGPNREADPNREPAAPGNQAAPGSGEGADRRPRRRRRRRT